MTGSALEVSSSESRPRNGVRFPVLPGRTPIAQGVDTACEAFRSGHTAASIEFAEEKAALQQSHEAFVDSVGVMLGEMEARYREESLSLISRLFAAVAPALARQSALSEIMSLVEERISRSGDELKLKVHPELISHLSVQSQKTLNENPRIILETDEACAPSSIDARWSRGGFINDPDALIKEILSTLGVEASGPEEPSHEQ